MDTNTAAATTATAAADIQRALRECMKEHRTERVECNREPGHKGQHRYIRNGNVVHAWTNRRTA